MKPSWTPTLGAIPLGQGRCQFRVWAPKAQRVELRLLAPEERLVEMQPQQRGYFEVVVEGVEPGALYKYRLDGDKERPDPASRFQPEGVHGPSQVVASDYGWDEGCWGGIPLEDYVIYELHVGTFTSQGTFEAMEAQLDELKDLGVTAVEIMPIAQFPGARNWGYDGVFPYAVQHSYGTPDQLRALVNACHRRGLAVVLDVVYNHMGPEGNYLWDYGHYFTDAYKTPWGSAVNFDGPHSDEVRHFFIENALYWVNEFHIDALRLDAVHAMLDFSAGTFLEELTASVHQQRQRLDRRVYLIAESNRNDPRLLRPVELGGYGLDAQWADDLHHVLHVLLTGESKEYYQSYTADSGRTPLQLLVHTLRQGFAYTGQYSPYQKRRFGLPAHDVPGERFVVCLQNHDQVGNRPLGERISELTSFEGLKLGAGMMLLSPFVPMLFMGEEYGETAPFLYFIDHSDEQLVAAVRKGRAEEFVEFFGDGKQPPDPQSEQTMARSRLNRELRQQPQNAQLYALYKQLLRLRRERPALATLSKQQLDVIGYEKQQVLFLHRWHADDEAVAIFNFGQQQAALPLPLPAGRWRRQIDSASFSADSSAAPGQIVESDGELSLTLSPQSFILLTSER